MLLEMIVGIGSLLLVALSIFIGVLKFGGEPCPREEAGWPCKKEKGQKCECEE